MSIVSSNRMRKAVLLSLIGVIFFGSQPFPGFLNSPAAARAEIPSEPQPGGQFDAQLGGQVGGQAGGPLTGPTDASGHHPLGEQDAAQKEMLARLAVKRNEERQRQIVRDTGKLLALATELKSDVDKTNKDVLSIDVIKKADEIEKLSKSIKERMKD